MIFDDLLTCLVARIFETNDIRFMKDIRNGKKRHFCFTQAF